MTEQEQALTIAALLRRNARAQRDKPVLVADDGALSHGQLDQRSHELARQLVAAGIGTSSRVGLIAQNGIGWVVTAMAVTRIGAVLVPLSTLLKPPELRAHLDTAAVTHLIAVPEFRGRRYLDEIAEITDTSGSPTSSGGLPLLRAVWPLDAVPGLPAPDDVVVALEDVVRPADDLAVLFTSGSSGTPKGVIHTHGSALRATASGLEARCVRPDERLYIPMPFFWTGGFGSGLLTTLLAGATLITEAIPEPAATLRLLQRERVTLFRGWPDQAAALAASPDFGTADLRSLRPGSLGAVLPPDVRPPAGARASLYGMTETCGPCCGHRLDEDLPDGKQGSCGRPFDGVEFRILDPDTGRRCDPDVPGEVCVRGPNVLRGICGRLRDEVFDPDGFYHTGDLGMLDADGFFWYRGRLDDMFKVKGATVFPSEVEAALRAVPGVRQAYVTNVPAGGQNAVGALIVSARPQEEVAADLRDRLSAFKMPTRWVATASADDVPMLASSKIDRAALRAMLGEQGRSS